MARSSSEGHIPNILVSSASGTTHLIMIQLASRAFTFAANQLILRRLSPVALGIATQLELYLISILYFSRESIRMAIQRQPLEISSTAAINSDKGCGRDCKNSDVTEAQSIASQSVVNVSYLCFGVGIPLVLICTPFYFHFVPKEISEQPSFQVSLIMTGIASLLELGVEPFFAVVQQRMLYRTRAIVETSAALMKSLSVCGMFIWAAWASYDIGVLPFALGYLSHSLTLICGYSITMLKVASENHFSFLLTPIKPSGGTSYVADRFSKRLILLSANVFFQTVVKHILTQGDSMMLAAMSSLEDQGIYSLASNYGGLIARIFFQPIEESSRNLFSTLLTSDETSKQNMDYVSIAKAHLIDILQVYGILSLIIIPLGPLMVPLTLHILGGRQWSSPKVDSLLSLYCYYIPFLAFNGITEAFVSCTANPSELRRQTGWMGAFSVCFALAAYVFLKLGHLGAHGLVWANIVNMAIRILWSYFSIKSFFRRHGNDLSVVDVSLHFCSYIIGILATSMMLANQGQVATEFYSVMKTFAVGIAYTLLILCLEKEYLMKQYNKIRHLLRPKAVSQKAK